MSAQFQDIITELKAIRQSVEALRKEQERRDPPSSEISAKEALKIMRCKTHASLVAMAKFCPSVRIRRGVYDRETLRYALSAREELARMKSGRI